MQHCPWFSLQPSANYSVTPLSPAGSAHSSRESGGAYPASHVPPSSPAQQKSVRRQVIENAKRQSVEGLALPFLMNWLLGECSQTPSRFLAAIARDVARRHQLAGMHSDAPTTLPDISRDLLRVRRFQPPQPILLLPNSRGEDDASSISS
ncbi:hypothetical protein NUW54_g5936 [Trametes sanguinea]|uniref:Uncharacterized protein n=1 Tax=Trametes sanguinea TaxID=158606 RepID=A0ACC1PW77_9APHY|nr:hypothetical protein NUW54_g5936 [Trametes sanguinea]